MERGYNARGYLSTLADATTGTSRTLVAYGAMDARGNIETETFGNGAQTTRAHDPKTGRPRAIGTARGTSTFQSHAYAWLTDGSLASRTANAAGSGASARALRKEEFDYDYLGRLDSAATKLGGSTTASRTLDYGYDNRGNLTSKTSDAAGDKSVTATMYEQRSAGPHALTRATVDGVVHDFRYDAQGHLERDDAASGDDRFIEWDGRGLATKVTVGEAKDTEKPAARETFLYGPGGARYLKTSEWKVVAADGTAAMKSETTYYAGGYEKRTRACETSDGTSATESVERTRVGPVLHVKRTPCGNSTAGPAEIEYRHFDHLGSSASITSAAGAELVALAHDPHGERRKPDWTRRLSEAEIAALGTDHGDRTSRGFTGHEHLDRTGLVHMNGRLYDPLLGRFLSPDPIVANPADGQQWNLYSYAMNSPLSYVDPSGLSFCDPAQQSWCGGVGLPSGGWGGRGGYSTRTVSGWSAYVTFGVYYEIVRIWSSVSVSRWDAGVEGWGSWGSTDDTFWEDVQRSVVYPIVQFFFWSFQVVEQGAANEPATGHSAHSGNGQPMTRADRQAANRRTFPSPEKILANYPDRSVKYCPYRWVENECAARLGIALQNVQVDISGSHEKRKTHTHDPNPQIHQPGGRALADYLEDILGRSQRFEGSVPWTEEMALACFLLSPRMSPRRRCRLGRSCRVAGSSPPGVGRCERRRAPADQTRRLEQVSATAPTVRRWS